MVRKRRGNVARENHKLSFHATPMAINPMSVVIAKGPVTRWFRYKGVVASPGRVRTG